VLEELTYTSVPLSEVIGHLPLSLRYLRDEQASTNPHAAPFLQFNEGSGYGVTENVT
jgi:hypothetical protein